MDKNFSHLKQKQKDFIINCLLEGYLEAIKDGTRPSKEQKEDIVNQVYEKLQEREISISYGEVKKQFSGKLQRWNLRYIKQRE